MPRGFHGARAKTPAANLATCTFIRCDLAHCISPLRRKAKFPPATAKDFAIIHRTPMTARSTLVGLMSMVLAFRRVCGMPVEYRRRKEL